MAKPLENTYPAFYSNYINLVEEDDLMVALTAQTAQVDFFFIEIEEEKSCLNYAPGKWTLKELLQHIIDTERIFMYRALCISRQEKQSLPGFDENEYAINSFANERAWKDLCDEYIYLRKSCLHLFKSFTPEMLLSSGISNDKPITTLAIGYALIGHLQHHINIINERYLSK